MIEVNKENWDSILSSKEDTLVEVYSSTCVPCKLVSRELKELEKDATVKVYKITVVTLQELDSELFSKLSGIPTLLFIKDGNMNILPKVYSRKQIEEQLQKYVGGTQEND